MSSRNSSRLSEDGPRKRSSNSVEAVALFPRLHVSHAQNTGPGSGPRAPPRNKMALYEQITLPSKRSFSTFMSSSASMGGSISLHGQYNQPSCASPAQGHGVASASQWVWSSDLEFPARHMLHKGDQTSVAMMGKRRQLGIDLFQQGPMPPANSSPYYSICTPPLYRPFLPHQAHPHLQPLPFLVPFNGNDCMYHHPIPAPSSANSAVESDLGELQRVPGMPSVPSALAGPVQGVVPSQPPWPVMDHGVQKKTASQDQGVATGPAAFVSGAKSSQPVRKGQEAGGMASGVRYGESWRERTPNAPRGKGAGSKAGTSSTLKRRAAREEEDGCVVPSIETPSCRSRDGRTTATSAIVTMAASVSGHEGGGVVSSVQQAQQPNVPGQSNDLAAGDGPLTVRASADNTSRQTSSRQAAVGTGVGRGWQRLANEQCEGDIRTPGIVPIAIDPAVERMQDSDCPLVKEGTCILPRRMSSLNGVEIVCSPSDDNCLPLTEDDDEDKTTLVPTGRISATKAGCSEPGNNVEDRSMDRMEGKAKYSALETEGNGEEEDPLHKNKKKKRDSSADEMSGSDDGENSSRSHQLPSAMCWDDNADDVMGNGVGEDAQNKQCCVIMAMDVVKVIGQKGFWDLRKTILRQQRIFSSQVAELHRVVKVQRMLAADPSLASVKSSMPFDGNHLRAKEILMKNAYATRDEVIAAFAKAATTCMATQTVPVESVQSGLGAETTCDVRGHQKVKNTRGLPSGAVESCAVGSDSTVRGASAYAAQHVGRECSKVTPQQCDKSCGGRARDGSYGMAASTSFMPPPPAPMYTRHNSLFPQPGVPAIRASDTLPAAAAAAVGMGPPVSMHIPPRGSHGGYYPQPHHSGILLPTAALQWYAASSSARAVGVGPQAGAVPPAVGSSQCLWPPGAAMNPLRNDPHSLSAHFFQPFATPATVGAVQYHPHTMAPTAVSPVHVPLPRTYSGVPSPLITCSSDTDSVVAATSAAAAATAGRMRTAGSIGNLPHLTPPMTLLPSSTPTHANPSMSGLLTNVELYPPYAPSTLHMTSPVGAQPPWCGSHQQAVGTAAAAPAAASVMSERIDAWYMMHPSLSRDMVMNGQGSKGISGTACGMFFDFPSTSREKPRGKEKAMDSGVLAPKDGRTHLEDGSRSGKEIAAEDEYESDVDDDDYEQDKEEGMLHISQRWVDRERTETSDGEAAPCGGHNPGEKVSYQPRDMRPKDASHTGACDGKRVSNVSSSTGRRVCRSGAGQELFERTSEGCCGTTIGQGILQMSNQSCREDVGDAQRPRDENNRKRSSGLQHGADKNGRERRGWANVGGNGHHTARKGSAPEETDRKGGSTAAIPSSLYVGRGGEKRERPGLLPTAAEQYAQGSDENSQYSADRMSLRLGHVPGIPPLPLLSSLHPGALAAAHAVSHNHNPQHQHPHTLHRHQQQQQASLQELCPPLPLLLQAHHSSIMAHPCNTSSPSLLEPATGPGPSIRPIKVVPTKAAIARPESTAGILQSLQCQREPTKK